MLHALSYAYVHRRDRKNDFRRLWITRINAGARQAGLSYSQLMHGLKLAGIEIDRKILAEMAFANGDDFVQLVGNAKGALASA